MARYTFQGIVFDDVVLKDSDGYKDWSQVCHDCVQEHRLHAHKDAIIKDISVSGQTCGIAGCSNEADFYIDFADGALVPEQQSLNHDDELAAIKQRLQERSDGISVYERQLRGMESTLGYLRYRVNSHIPLSGEELEHYRELPHQLRDTRRAFREDYPGVPATLGGIEKEIQRQKNIIGSIELYSEGHIPLDQLQQHLEAQGIQFPSHQTNVQQQPGHHDRPPEERVGKLADRFKLAEEARKVQERSREYDHDH